MRCSMLLLCLPVFGISLLIKLSTFENVFFSLFYIVLLLGLWIAEAETAKALEEACSDGQRSAAGARVAWIESAGARMDAQRSAALEA